ncbi:MAG: radical SAM protein, partial [Oscillospiraceae bacterium]|nr:radical SAM protein [Oscillospiraceae bacterium]
MYSRVYVEITNICNMNCSFCHGHSRKAGRMSPDEFSRVLDKLAGQTKYIYYHLMGEPLTHPQLSDFIRLATGKGFRSVITTNGTLLKKR